MNKPIRLKKDGTPWRVWQPMTPEERARRPSRPSRTKPLPLDQPLPIAAAALIAATLVTLADRAWARC